MSKLSNVDSKLVGSTPTYLSHWRITPAHSCVVTLMWHRGIPVSSSSQSLIRNPDVKSWDTSLHNG